MTKEMQDNKESNAFGKAAMTSAATLLGGSWATYALTLDPFKKNIPGCIQDGLQGLHEKLSDTTPAQILNNAGAGGIVPGHAGAVAVGAALAAVSFPLFLYLYQHKESNTETHVSRLAKKEGQSSLGIAPHL